MDDHEVQRTWMLLQIVEASAKHGAKLANVTGTAMEELSHVNEGLKKKPTATAPMAAKPRVVTEPTGNEPVRPNVYPNDSQTATIADRRI